MIPHKAHRDMITLKEINELLAALDEPPTPDHLRGAWWHRIVAATGIDVARIDYPQASEWNAAADYTNNLTATKENNQ